MQDEFLYSPVEELCDEENFFGGACDLVDPAELLELFAVSPKAPRREGIELGSSIELWGRTTNTRPSYGRNQPKWS